MCNSLLSYQGLEEKPNSLKKVFKQQSHSGTTIIQMATPAHLNRKDTGKRSCFAQVSSDQATPGGSWRDQVLAQLGSELSSLAGKLLGGTEQLVPMPITCQQRGLSGQTQC